MSGPVRCPSTGKICHTKAVAKVRARALQRATVTSRSISVYRCPDWKLHRGVGHFHIGHTPHRLRRLKGLKR